MPLRTLNRVELLGVIGKDPEVKNLSGGKILAKIPIGIRLGGKNDDGTYKDDIEWYQVTAWGTEAEILSKYAKKGDDIHIEGYLKNTQWEKDGEKRYNLEIHVRRTILLGGKRVHVVDGEVASQPQQTPQPQQPSQAPSGDSYYPDDDLPF